LTSTILKSILSKFLPNQTLPTIIETLMVDYGIEIFPVETVVPVSKESQKQLFSSTTLESFSETSQTVAVPQFKCSCKQGILCTSPGKHPANGILWKQGATTSASVFQKLSKGKTVNYGVATGRLSAKTNKYLVVVDIDDKSHSLIEKLPKTFRYKTGSGGFHFWFWSSSPVQNSQGIIKKVDIRGTGGYVVVPPSSHVSGDSYEMISDVHDPILDFPEFLKELLHESSQLKRATTRNNNKTRISSEPWRQLPKKVKIEGLASLGKSIVEKNLRLQSQKKTTQTTQTKQASVGLVKTPPKVGLSRKKLAARTARRAAKAVKNMTPSDTAWWSLTSVSQMISAIKSGFKVPLGIRNASLHRFLASERGKGVCHLPDIIHSANSFISHLEDPGSFSETETLNVCKSVMRYPAYLQDPNLVNESYSRWMSDNYEVEVPVGELNDLDEIFFSMLKPIAKEKKKPLRTVSLVEVTKLRKDWLIAREKSGFANYKSQLLAKKLESLGFEKQRTAKSNTWLIDVSAAETALASETLTFNNKQTRLADYRKSFTSQLPSKRSVQENMQLAKLDRDAKTERTRKEADLIRNSKVLATPIISIANHNSSAMLGVYSNLSQRKVMHMSDTSDTSEVEETTTPASPASPEEAVDSSESENSGPIGPDGEPLTLVEEREDVINAVRKYNPSDVRYSGHGGTADGTRALINLMAKLPPEKANSLAKPSFFFDKERTLDFISTIQEGDILGIRTDMWKIVSAKNSKLKGIKRLLVHNKYEYNSENIETIKPKDIDMAFAMASCEILYREDTPYGLEPELSYKVKVKLYSDSKGRTYIFRTGKEVKTPILEPGTTPTT